jgi:uncharacterized lipoprotein YbaY
MTQQNIILALLDILKKDKPKKVIICDLINNGLMNSDFYKIGFNDDDINAGLKYDFKGK